MPISRALLSVSDKSGIVPFAKFLHQKGIEIISTGGTAKVLSDHDIPVTEISDYTGFPEMLSGRVKTLHPSIHGGLLFRRGDEQHEREVADAEIGAIDLVVVNLYPFEETVASGAEEEDCIEKIDIGGPSMLRSAAKNFAAVTVVTEPEDLKIVQEQIEKDGNTTPELRKKLAGKVFEKTSLYDAAIADFFGAELSESFELGEKVTDLRYGENPHQSAAFFMALPPVTPSIGTATVYGEKQLGYCNILDADAALRLILEFNNPAAAIIKHATPCGVSVAEDVFLAYTNALEADPVSAFGGIVAVNRGVDKALAQKMSEHFLEVIIAPEFSVDAREVLLQKKNLRLLETGTMQKPHGQHELRSVLGGVLRQQRDDSLIGRGDLTSSDDLTDDEVDDLLFAWRVVKHVKSNAIVLVKDGVTIGIGGGQTSRVASSEIAVDIASENAKGAVAASDGFFPFPDGVETLAQAGVTAIIQPGGSKKDDEVVETAKKLGVKMVFTGMRVFRH